MANTGNGFVLSNGTVSAPAAFIFDTIDGHIEAWSPKVDPVVGNAEDKVTVPGAGYTGLAIASAKSGDELFAADFATGKVDVFDSGFHQVQLASWQFRDPALPKGYRAFGTQTLDGRIFVTYAKMDPTTGREAVGAGMGVVDEFSSVTAGSAFSRRMATTSRGMPLARSWTSPRASRSRSRGSGAAARHGGRWRHRRRVVLRGH